VLSRIPAAAYLIPQQSYTTSTNPTSDCTSDWTASKQHYYDIRLAACSYTISQSLPNPNVERAPVFDLAFQGSPEGFLLEAASSDDQEPRWCERKF
jgi:hypothetical protein